VEFSSLPIKLHKKLDRGPAPDYNGFVMNDMETV